MTPPTDARDRAQLILVGAVAIAVVLLGLVVVFNTVLYTETKTTTATLDESTRAQAFAQQVGDEVGRIATGLAGAGSLTESTLDARVAEWSEAQSISHAHTGPVFVNVSPAPGGCDPSPCTLLSSYAVSVTWTADGFDYRQTVTAPLSPFAESVAYYDASSGDPVLHTASDAGVTGEFPGANNVSTTGPISASLDGNPNDVEIAYVGDNDDIVMVNAEVGTTQTLVDASVASDTPDGDATSIAAGRWDGNPPSVYYTAGDKIYRVEPGGFSPTLVADVSGGSADGASGVIGFGDVDSDSNEELVYVGNSQIPKYIDSGGATSGTDLSSNSLGTSSSGTGLGAGRVAEFDGLGTRIVYVDGSNDIRLVNAGSSTVINLNGPSGSDEAAKNLVAPVDVDSDGETEIVYKRDGSNDLQYVDDVGDSNAIEEFGPDSLSPGGGATQ